MNDESGTPFVQTEGGAEENAEMIVRTAWVVRARISGYSMIIIALVGLF